jgi:hypothetical protein
VRSSPPERPPSWLSDEQLGLARAGAGQVGAGQVGAGQVGAGQVGVGQVGVGQVGVSRAISALIVLLGVPQARECTRLDRERWTTPRNQAGLLRRPPLRSTACAFL